MVAVCLLDSNHPIIPDGKLMQILSIQSNDTKTERDAGSVGFLHLLFFPFFHFHLSICPKSQGKPRRSKKNNPVRRIWSKSIPDCFFVFLVFLVFLEVFWCPKPQLSKNSRKTKRTKKKQKKQSCEKNLG